MAESLLSGPETPNTTLTSKSSIQQLPLQHKNYHTPTGWLQMVGSQAVGLPLVKQGNFAADMLRFEPGQRTSLHTHPGDHILFVVSGCAWLDYDQQEYWLSEGECYYVPGSVPHRIRASDSGMHLLSIASQHRPVDSAERLVILEDV